MLAQCSQNKMLLAAWSQFSSSWEFSWAKAFTSTLFSADILCRVWLLFLFLFLHVSVCRSWLGLYDALEFQFQFAFIFSVFSYIYSNICVSHIVMYTTYFSILAGWGCQDYSVSVLITVHECTVFLKYFKTILKLWRSTSEEELIPTTPIPQQFIILLLKINVYWPNMGYLLGSL